MLEGTFAFMLKNCVSTLGTTAAQRCAWWKRSSPLPFLPQQWRLTDTPQGWCFAYLEVKVTGSLVNFSQPWPDLVRVAVEGTRVCSCRTLFWRTLSPTASEEKHVLCRAVRCSREVYSDLFLCLPTALALATTRHMRRTRAAGSTSTTALWP